MHNTFPHSNHRPHWLLWGISLINKNTESFGGVHQLWYTFMTHSSVYHWVDRQRTTSRFESFNINHFLNGQYWLLKSYTQVYSGNQKLSWHGTTLQAVQPLPNIKDGQVDNRRRARETSSPSHSPELSKDTNTTHKLICDASHHFEDTSNYKY